MLKPSYKKNIGLLGSVLCLCLLFLSPSTASAQGVDIGAWIGEGLAAVIYPLALGIGGLFIGIAGLALDMSIKFLIVDMGTLLNNEVGVGISSVWVMIRDMFNILFIFSFIFLGIKTILNSDDSSTRRGIINIIIAGLFINFSMLIALTIIDFTNIAATQIYQLILNSASMTATEAAGPAFLGQNTISGAFMEVASVGSWLTPSYPAGITGFNKILYAIMMMVFFMITAIIFLFATYHIIYRFVALCIYLILSPVLFLGLILPNFKSYSDKWLKGLLKQSFYAPAHLFMLYVSLVVLGRLKAQFGGDTEVGLTTMFEGKGMTSGSFSIFLLFALSIGFIYASVKVGEMMGISGSKATLGIIDKGRQAITRGVGNATFGALAGVGKGTIGNWAHRVSESSTLRDRTGQRSLDGWFARRQFDASRVIGDASFDVRQVAGFGRTTGLGEGAKGGYKTQLEEIKKKEAEYSKSQGQVEEDDERVNYFIEQRNAYDAILKRQKEEKEKIRDKKLEDEVKKLKDERENVTDKALEDEIDRITAAAAGIDPTDLAAKQKNKEDLLAAERKLKEYKKTEKDKLSRQIDLKEEELKQSVQKLKDEKNKEIEETEKAIKATDNSIAVEKNRRQVGIDIDPATASSTSAEYAVTKTELKTLKDELASAIEAKKSEEEKMRITERIKEVNKKRKDLALKAKEAHGTFGYAGVLEKRSWFGSMVLGRVASQDHAAGKEVRKQFSKGSAKEAADKK